MRTTGMQADQFTVSDIADPRFLLMLNTINPSFRLTMPEGRRIRLKVTDHRCVFLTPAGCSLPVLVRPIYCRVYPFWFDSDGRLLLLRSHRCLAQQDALSPYDVMHRLEMSEPDLRELFDRWLILARDHSA
jgi:Fe-S-cluster containining protein